MNTQCPKCKQVFETEENAVGQWVKCPECGGEWCVLTPDEEQKIIDTERQKAIDEAKIPEEVKKSEIIKAELYKNWIRDYSWIKVCPVCKKRYFANYYRDKNKYFQCSCGQYVKIDEPEKHFFWTCVNYFQMLCIFALMIGVFIGIPAFLIAWGISSCSSTSSVNSHATSQRKSTISRESGKIDAWVFTQYLVEQHLKSPKSAKFPFGGAQNHVEETVPGIYIIRSYVDAKNAFGAEIRQHFFCKLQRKSDGKFEVLQLTFQ